MKNLFFIFSTVLCTYLSYNIPTLSFIMLFALIPLFYVLIYSAKSVSESIKYSFIFSILYYGLNFSWFTKLYPLDWLGLTKSQSIFIIIIGLLFITLNQSLTLTLIGLIPNKIRPHKLKLVIYLPTLWVLIEYLQQKGPLALPWIRLYLSQYANTYFIQIANIFGSLSISFIIVLINILILNLLVNKNVKYIYPIVIILTLTYSYGVYSINYNTNYSYKTNCSIIQANISSSEKWNASRLNNIIDSQFELSKSEYNKNKPNIIIWGETSIPTSFDNKIINKIKTFTDQTDSILVTGCFNYNQNKWYNSVAAIDNTSIQYYNKSHLVPFGEYIPFRSVISKYFSLSKVLNAFGEDLTTGKDLSSVNISNYNLASLICFESLFPTIARRTSKNADFIIVVSNDSWYKDSQGVYQHNAHNVFRAVENNKYLLRAANSGISSIIDNHGKIIKTIPPLHKGSINATIYANKNKSLYNKYGDWFIYLCTILFISVIYNSPSPKVGE